MRSGSRGWGLLHGGRGRAAHHGSHRNTLSVVGPDPTIWADTGRNRGCSSGTTEPLYVDPTARDWRNWPSLACTRQLPGPRGCVQGTPARAGWQCRAPDTVLEGDLDHGTARASRHRAGLRARLSARESTAVLYHAIHQGPGLERRLARSTPSGIRAGSIRWNGRSCRTPSSWFATLWPMPTLAGFSIAT